MGIFDLHMGGLDRKVGGLDRAWTAFGSPMDWLGQRLDRARPALFSSRAGLHSDFTRLRQPLAAPSTGLDKDRTLMLEHSGGRPAAVPSWLSRMEPKRLRAQDNVVESTTNRKQ